MRSRSIKAVVTKVVFGCGALCLVAIASNSLWSLGDSASNETSSTITSSEVSAVRMPARFDGEIFSAPGKENEKAVAHEATLKTGIRALRARKVRFNSEPLRVAKRPGDRLVRFELFKDTVFTVRFLEPSPQLSRRAEFVGQVEGDPDSRVQLWATKNALSGELATAGRTFRFVSATGGFHYIVEVDPSR